MDRNATKQGGGWGKAFDERSRWEEEIKKRLTISRIHQCKSTQDKRETWNRKTGGEEAAQKKEGEKQTVGKQHGGAIGDNGTEGEQTGRKKNGDALEGKLA